MLEVYFYNLGYEVSYSWQSRNLELMRFQLCNWEKTIKIFDHLFNFGFDYLGTT